MSGSGIAATGLRTANHPLASEIPTSAITAGRERTGPWARRDCRSARHTKGLQAAPRPNICTDPATASVAPTGADPPGCHRGSGRTLTLRPVRNSAPAAAGRRVPVVFPARVLDHDHAVIGHPGQPTLQLRAWHAGRGRDSFRRWPLARVL